MNPWCFLNKYSHPSLNTMCVRFDGGTTALYANWSWWPFSGMLKSIRNTPRRHISTTIVLNYSSSTRFCAHHTFFRLYPDELLNRTIFVSSLMKHRTLSYDGAFAILRYETAHSRTFLKFPVPPFIPSCLQYSTIACSSTQDNRARHTIAFAYTAVSSVWFCWI